MHLLNIFPASFPVQYKTIRDKNNWITQGIKISWTHKISLYTFNANSNKPKAKVHYIKYCKILRNLIIKDKKQHYSRFTAKSNHTTKTTRSITQKETRKVHSVQQVPTLLVNDEKLKDPSNNAFSN
jgi:hypothetical protein